MKKVLAILMALIMLFSMSALAESDAFVFHYQDEEIVEINGITAHKIWIDLIPVYYVVPEDYQEGDDMKICLMLSGLSGNKEAILTEYAPYITAQGWTGVFFDHYMHGERANIQNPVTSLTASAEEVSALSMQILDNCFANMYRYGWEILGNSSLDTLRVVDYFYENYPVVESVMGGVSMGGDTSLVVAGMDRRINRILCFITAPDWLRPGMHNIAAAWGDPAAPADPGEPDAKSTFYFMNFSPSMNLNRYMYGDIDVMFVCGEVDTHINPNWVYTFREDVYRLNPTAGLKMGIWTNPGQGHATPGAEVQVQLFDWLCNGAIMNGAKYLSGDEQAWDRDYYYTMDTLPAGY